MEYAAFFGCTYLNEEFRMPTVLLVDDEPEILILLGEVLNRLGCQTIAKQDGRAALEVVRDGTPVDLVVTDYRMPDMDGLEFITSLKQKAPTVPVIMLTAYGSVETYLKAFNFGVYEYVNKPFRTKEFVRIVKAALDSTACGERQPGNHCRKGGGVDEADHR